MYELNVRLIELVMMVVSNLLIGVYMYVCW